MCYFSEVEHILVGMSKKLFLHLDKQNTKLNKKKIDGTVNKTVSSEDIVADENNKIDNIIKTKETRNKKLKEPKKKKIVVESEEQYTKENELEFEGAENKEESDSDEDGSKIIELNVEERISRKRKKTMESDTEDTPSKGSTKMSSDSSNVTSVPKLSGVTSFFNPEIKEENESSSDEEENVTCL